MVYCEQMENQDLKLPNTSKQSSSINESEEANQQNTNDPSRSILDSNSQPKFGKKRHILRNVLLAIVGLVIIIVVVVIIIIISIARDVTKPNKPADVTAAYAQTANKVAAQVMSSTSAASLFSKQSLPTDKPSGKTNEVNTLYCYTVSENANVVNQINQGFPQNDPWIYVGQADGTIATISALTTAFQKAGIVNLRYETQGDKLSTTNQNFNPAAVAYIGISLPSLSNPCSTPESQDHIQTANKLIISLQLDLFDYPYGKSVIIWQSPAKGPEYQSLTNGLSLMALTNIDKQTYTNVTSQKEIYYPDPEYSYGTYTQVGESMDLCLAGNENPGVALTAIDNAFNKNGWQANYEGDDNVPYVVNAMNTKQSIEGISFLYTKSSDLGQISATFNPDGTFTDGSTQCSLGNYTHAFSISLSYSK